MNITVDRRSFLKASATVGGGFVLGFAFANGSESTTIKNINADWSGLNAYLSIHPNGKITIMSTNPEIGQNIKTAFPMIVADELGADWKDVVVEQAGLDTKNFKRQTAGGSQSIRYSFNDLRNAGATARTMLTQAAANRWKVDVAACTVALGFVHSGNNKAGFGELAAEAALLEVPKDVKLKDIKDFHIIGTSRKNVDVDKIITGQPQFGYDTYVEGMKYAFVKRPPAFGQKLVDFNAEAALKIPGVEEVIRFGEKIAVVAKDTWSGMQGKKALVANYTSEEPLEQTSRYDSELTALLVPSGNPRRNDGDMDAAIAQADQVIERIYEAPFLPHNCMEPMNFFAHVEADKTTLIGPIQTPEGARKAVSDLVGQPVDNVSLMMTRMGGGFGRRLYNDYVVEAAEVSMKTKKPIQLLFTREDDMESGTYRPAAKYKFTATIKDGEMTGYQLIGSGINTGNVCKENNFPAGGVDNYRVYSANLTSKVTTGAWRAPVTNFLACAEQSFIDEVAEACKQDAIEFRLKLMAKASKVKDTVKMDYDPDRFANVLKLAAEKSGWKEKKDSEMMGFSAYYSHNTYVAEVAHMASGDGGPVLSKVTCAFDCGILINPLSALNQVEGGVVDGIGHAMFGNLTIKDGVPQQNNFNNYRLIRMSEAPKVESYFVESTEHPCGLGEPTLPPAGGALANALYKATGKRLYKQPFVQSLSEDLLG